MTENGRPPDPEPNTSGVVRDLLSQAMAEPIDAAVIVGRCLPELFENGACLACGALVADQAAHVAFHDRLQGFTEAVSSAFQKLSKPRRRAE
ncbi:hypothetical protein [Nocardia farcinica]|uniref:hypothetical protein n=1 Tax=Nocardia farcinica TaxID=37329 RepID=UPI0012FECBAD|nr:hypothetical protein [Nocardia farcinica]